MSEVDINAVLSQMRALAARAQGFEPPTAPPVAGGSAGEGPFARALAGAVDQVNTLQHRSAALAEALERGQPGVDAVQVMLASQKAGLAFEALAQVRNRMVSAYQEIMNMPL